VTPTPTATATPSDLIVNTPVLGDFWAIDAGAVSTNPPTNNARQRVMNSTPITITQLEVCLGVPNAETGNIHFEIWSDKTTGCPGTDPSCPDVKLGDSSDDIAVGALAAMPGTPVGACGDPGNGQKVTVTWTANNPNPTGNFWIVGVDNDTGGIVGSFIAWAASAPNTPDTYVDTTFDAWKADTDEDEDFYFIVRGL